MKRTAMTMGLWASVSLAVAAEAPGSGGGAPAAIPLPQDRPYPGEMHLVANASDYNRRIVRVHETLSGLGANAILLYPKWLPGTHAPEGPIDRLSNIRITSGGAPVKWVRDTLDVYAFRLQNDGGTSTIDIDFDYLSPTSAKVGALEMSREILMVEWNELVLYPAGYYVRRIPVDAELELPRDWQFGSALEVTGRHDTGVRFHRVDLETLVDSPVYSGLHFQRFELDPGSHTPVRLDLMADRPELLNVTQEELAAYRSLVQQAYKLFNSRHYGHYDFLYSLSDQIQHNGLEHHQSSEDGSDPESFTEWEKLAFVRDLLPHEFTHSWNGKFRRPADLWTPDYNVPMQNSLLWVYEGQTQYWGNVLAARSGLRTRQQSLDSLALTAAYLEKSAGRHWRALQDTTNDEIINPRRPQSWPDQQRFEDYYDEGALIWLDADTLIRERSKGKRSLDDFARSFFGVDDGNIETVTYTFDDIVKALNAVEPYDWAAFLRARLDAVDKPVLGGIQRGGYRLVYTEHPSDLLRLMEEQRKRVELLYSIGIEVDDKDSDGTVLQVMWDSPAYKAGITESARIMAINGVAYSADVLKDAIGSAREPKSRIQLILRTGDRFTIADVEYHDGPKYPHLLRDPASPARLDEILSARK